MQNHQVVCYGEVLWDLLPTGKLAGGAPMNVAFQLNNLGQKSMMISRVGMDALGDELLSFLAEKGFYLNLIQKDSHSETGTVKVSLDPKGSPEYEIVKPVAWDHIQLEANAVKAVEESDALVFGSLACRSVVSRNSLFYLLTRAKLKVLDVNFRSPFYSKELIDSLLEKADIVKINEHELEEIAKWHNLPDQLTTQLEFLHQKFDLRVSVITMGGEGSIGYDGQQLIHQGSFPVQVKDTIGAGDAFLATFLTKYLAGIELQQCLQYANAAGAFVASKAGGTPDLSETALSNFIQNA